MQWRPRAELLLWVLLKSEVWICVKIVDPGPGAVLWIRIFLFSDPDRTLTSYPDPGSDPGPDCL
jgi:hypothetical protein